MDLPPVSWFSRPIHLARAPVNRDQEEPVITRAVDLPQSIVARPGAADHQPIREEVVVTWPMGVEPTLELLRAILALPMEPPMEPPMGSDAPKAGEVWRAAYPADFEAMAVRQQLPVHRDRAWVIRGRVTNLRLCLITYQKFNFGPRAWRAGKLALAGAQAGEAEAMCGWFAGRCSEPSS